MTGVVVVASLAALVPACGGDDEQTPAAEQDTRGKTQAFLQSMVPHHESAIAMARVAERRGEHREVKKLGAAIVRDQEAEIDTIKSVHRRLFKNELEPDPAAHELLGLSVSEAGMNHAEAATTLQGADPFDRAFIDAMIPHHEGAVRMAKAVRGDADDPDVANLAADIIAAQEKEIAQMKRWRKEWYGSAMPAEMEGHGSDPGH